MSMMKEFKDFAMRGNVLDLAVGVVIGGAFGAIVSSLVNDIIMPLVGALTGGYDVSGLMFRVGEAEVKYGMFLQAVVNFLIIAFAIFVVVKLVNSMKKKKEEAPAPAPAPPKSEVLLEEIRDLLKNK